MTWLYNEEKIDSIPEGSVGFTYCITRLTDGKKYLGKKNYFFSATRQVKGKKKRYKKESDWKTYWSSSETLKKSVEELGESFFRREILRICYTKAEMGYYEAREQLLSDCILKPNEFLNEWVSFRVRRAHMKKWLT